MIALEILFALILYYVFSMQIGIYANFGGNPTGVGRYGVEIAKALKQKNSLVELWINRKLTSYADVLNSVGVPEIFFPKFRRITDFYWPGWRFRKAGLDAILCPGTTMIKTLLPIKQAVMVHDMGPFMYPEMKRKDDTAAWRKRIRQAAARADVITTNSLTTKNDLLNEFPHIEDRVFNTPLGTDHFPYRPDHVPGGKHILAVSTIEPRKNYKTLLCAYSILESSHDNSLPPLVIAGGMGFRAQEIIGYASEFGISHKVTFTGYVSGSELADLYSNAACLVHTAHYEGFGFMVPEAFSWNLPVAAPYNSAIKEYFGKAAWMIDISNSESVASGIMLCLEKGVTADQQIERARLSGILTWDNCADMTLKALEEVLS
ncbi:hypothetical protein DRQ25_02715 [Candidatus Fermentibacteria bacterium]|nr:MAG: hypothetical protein DRQ25_02715 [Candidatus Fermentibacteria bacterium]